MSKPKQPTKDELIAQLQAEVARLKEELEADSDDDDNKKDEEEDGDVVDPWTVGTRPAKANHFLRSTLDKL